MSERLIRGALAFFAAAAALGVVVALAGPVPFVRLLGVAALLCGSAGCLVQLYALRTFAPDAYAELRSRLGAMLATAIEASRSIARGSRARAARTAPRLALPA